MSWARGARPISLAAVLATALLLLASAARAEPCGRPDVDATFPPHDASGVPQNAILAAHYTAPADYGGEAVTLTRNGTEDVLVDAAYDAAESMLRAVPVAPLVAGEYHILWPALRGVATGVGLGTGSSFAVGAAIDSAPPHFDGLRAATWDFSRETDPCTDSLEDRYTYELSLGELGDDQATALLSVVVFETKGPGRAPGAAPTELAVVPLPSGGGSIHITRPSNQAGNVCFAAVLRDLALNVSGGGDEEACVATVEPPFFEGCSLALRGRSAPASGAAWVIAGLALALRRRRRAALGALGLGGIGALSLLGCSRPPTSDAPPSAPKLARASAFECRAGACSQRQPRLPDDGEWRCAELDGTVLCAGGEPAAGAVAGPADPAYRCGYRPNGERVCLDRAPDYPPGGPGVYACRFDAAHGGSRECREQPTPVPHPVLAALPSGSPECWLDRDCAERCERGYCSGAPR
jgi:hypothetical protein